MAERTVKVKLTADISDYTASLIKAAGLTRQLGGDIERDVDRHVAPAMRRSGEKSGGLLARGIQTGVMRNSPLIVAGVSAALAAGAPAVLAGATALFAGVGAIAAAQTTEVREAWTRLGHDIRDGAVQDAAVLVPVYVGMADKIGAAFERMRPELRGAFAAAAPQIDQFTESLIRAAEQIMPALIRAVERGGPVIEGLGHLMEQIGTGLADFLDGLSSHSDAAGRALASIGDVLGAALPLLGDLLGTGAEIASQVLPALVTALHAVHGVLELVAPILPALATGFLAFRVVSSLGPMLDSFSGGLKRTATNAAVLSPALNSASTAVGKLGTALPIVGLAFAGWSLRTAAINKDLSEFRAGAEAAFTTLRQGGEAAEQAATRLKVYREIAKVADGGDFAKELREAEQASRDAWEALGPLGQAQQTVTEKTHALEAAVGKYGPTSDQARTASANLTAAQAALAGVQRDVQLATDGVTQAMLEQATQAAAAANSDLGYRMSVDATEEAVAALNTAIQEHGVNSEQASDAALALEQALLGQATAARQSALDTSTATSEAGKNAEADAAMLAELLSLRDTMGTSFPAALNTTISRLQGSTNAGMVAAAQFNQLGLNILAVPNSKTVIVSSTTPEQIALLERLGYKVTHLENGTVQVTALTGDAETALSNLTKPRYATVFVTTQQSGVRAPISGQRQAGLAQGGIVHAFAGGGFEPMQGGIARIVAPNTMRLIGDRVRDDEAYIPINGDARSHAILRQTAERMGYSLGREFSGMSFGGGSSSSVDNSRSTRIEVIAPPNQRAIANAIAERQRDLEFLHG